MRKYLNLIIFPIMLASTASVKTVVDNQVSGANSHTEITTTVNGKTTKVVSDKEGEIKVEIKDGSQVVTQTTPSQKPTASISPTTSLRISIPVKKNVKGENINTSENKTVLLFLNNFIKRIFNVFHF